MKRILMAVALVIALAGVGALMSVPVQAGKPVKAEKAKCTTIQDGVLKYSNTEEVISLGFDRWGYNYQGHMFSGIYDNYLRPSEVVEEGTSYLMMKWSDEWLSNKDCNNDGKLDRGYSCDPDNASSSACPGAWLTNHERGTYMEDGEICKYTYFVKIVTPSIDDGANKVDGYWYSADGTEIGEVIWGAFAITQEVSNDSCGGEHGLQFKSDWSSGLGFYNL